MRRVRSFSWSPERKSPALSTTSCSARETWIAFQLNSSTPHTDRRHGCWTVRPQQHFPRTRTKFSHDHSHYGCRGGGQDHGGRPACRRTRLEVRRRGFV